MLNRYRRPVRAPALSRVRRRSAARDALDRIRARGDGVQHPGAARGLRAAEASGVAAAQSTGSGSGFARLGVQYCGELRQQHELAGLRRRNHDELSHADARAHRPELRFCRQRHGGAGRVHPGLPACLVRDDRQLLGRPHAFDPLHPAAAVDPRRGGPGFARRSTDVVAVQDRGARPAGHVRHAQARRKRTGGERRKRQRGDRAGHSEGANDCRWPGGLSGR